MSSAAIEGYLKQQGQDANGLYTWDRKFFRLLADDAILEIHPDKEPGELQIEESPPGVVTIRGAKYAKEWSVTIPAIGSYGFDIVWSSGKLN